jgi:cellulose synthase/poly-beta-1,6-N-acetylglucosamine synthase-like glycosyltransferase
MTSPVDVVIAARNEARHIAECLDALRRQDYQGLIGTFVVDDASTDATPALAAAHGAVVIHQPGRGAGAARNAGLRAGRAPIVAFLDAHSIVSSDWIRRMVEPFSDPGVAGTQSRIDNRSDDARVQRYLEASGALSNARVMSDSILGERNLYPWMPTCTCVYRRAAVEEAGRFNEVLLACEDVDLSWRVILHGYRLVYVDAAHTTHYDGNPWRRFVRKGTQYGRGAAQLTQIYRSHGAGRTLRADAPWRGALEAILASLHYRYGFRLQQGLQRIGVAPRLQPLPLAPVKAELRPWFAWTQSFTLRLAPTAIYWFRDPDSVSVIVHPSTRSRYVLDGTADFVWRHLASERSRAQTIDAIVAHYGVAAATAGSDLDDLVEELLAGGLLERTV